MDWEDKMAAMKCLSPEAAIHMRAPGDWYLSLPGVEIKEGAILSAVVGNGCTPVAAVHRAWEELAGASLKGNPIVIDAYKDTRRPVQWAQFMWKDITP